MVRHTRSVPKLGQHSVSTMIQVCMLRGGVTDGEGGGVKVSMPPTPTHSRHYPSRFRLRGGRSVPDLPLAPPRTTLIAPHDHTDYWGRTYCHSCGRPGTSHHCSCCKSHRQPVVRVQCSTRCRVDCGLIQAAGQHGRHPDTAPCMPCARRHKTGIQRSQGYSP
jgi:hypothetical protein